MPTLLEKDDDLQEVMGRYAAARTADEKAILAAAQAVKERRQVVSLRAIVRGYYRPQIAVAPPWARTVRLRVYMGGRRRGGARLRCRRGLKRWSLFVPGAVTGRLPNRRFASTTVPPIPPAYQREVRPGTLVAWEVEEWVARPPRDPALLHPVDPESSDDMHEVGATWDLTQLERVALGA